MSAAKNYSHICPQKKNPVATTPGSDLMAFTNSCFFNYLTLYGLQCIRFEYGLMQRQFLKKTVTALELPGAARGMMLALQVVEKLQYEIK
jgi:hypothetical protein